MAPAHDDHKADEFDLGPDIDPATFEQILEMDDDDDEHEFSKGIVFDFFAQVESTFVDMDTALKDGNLGKLSDLGHFLKGSSATLGLTKVKDSCEKIQHYGHKKDAAGTSDEPDEKKCLQLIEETLATVKVDYAKVEKILRAYFAQFES